MESSLYPQMAALEKKHWWFSARRTIVDYFLSKLNLPTDTKILEAGCGTGGNLSLLAQYGQVFAIESNEMAREFASQNPDAEVKAGMLPNDIPFQNEKFDLIVLLDVLEHLEEDARSLQALSGRVKAGGYLVVTVPALPLLWSQHDDKHHHYRRYVKTGLRQLVENADFKIIKLSYFNFFLFPMVLLTRLLQRASKKAQDDLSLPSPWFNWLLKKIFASERYLINILSLPIGVSLILIAQTHPSPSQEGNR
jgi:SAM-dependent methyltransferase